MSVATVNVNDIAYWDNRFEVDWEENRGRQQSAFFAQVAFENFPGWLKSHAVRTNPSFCDWGCALGDGTDFLRRALSISNIYGIDFSEAGIRKAKELYPAVQFMSLDLTREELDEKFDIIFSSNTLEHFYQPWQTLNRIARFAKEHLVIIIPFKEYELCSHEHFYTFDFHNIPLQVNGEFFLNYSKVIDTSGLEPTYWMGKQVLLVYSRHHVLDGMFLENMMVEGPHSETTRAEAAKKENPAYETAVRQMLELESAMAERNRTISELQQALSGAQAAAIEDKANLHRLETALEEKNIAYNGELASLKAVLDGQENQNRELENRNRELENRNSELEEGTRNLQTGNEELLAQLAALNAKNLELQVSSDTALQALHAEYGEKLAGAAESLAGQQAISDRLAGELAEEKQNTAQLSQEKEALQSAINERESRLEKMQTQLRELNRKLSEAEEHFRLQSEKAATDTEALKNGYDQKLTLAQKRNENLADELALLNQKISNLAAEKQASEERLAAAREENALLLQQFSSVHAAIKDLQGEKQTLSAEKTELIMKNQKLTDLYKDIERSNSWRLTKPLRLTVYKMKKLLGQKVD